MKITVSVPVFNTLISIFRNNKLLESIEMAINLSGHQEKYFVQNPNVRKLHLISNGRSPQKLMIRENQLANLKSLKLDRFVVTDTNFKNLPNLTHFSFTGSSISGDCVASIFNMDNLRVVSLKQTRSLYMRYPTKDLSQLVNLDLSETYMDQTMSTCTLFQHMPNLLILNLSSNYFECLTFDMVSTLKNLKVLNLFRNIIGTIEENAFKNFTFLEVINLNDNKISKLFYQNIRDAKRLKRLHLAFNDLKSLDYAKSKGFKLFKTRAPKKGSESLLEVFDVQSNCINTIDKYFFSSMSNLKYLYLNDNSISMLCRSHFKSLHLLHYLDLSSNKIEIIDNDLFADLNRLNLLKIASNSIRVLHSDVFQVLVDLCVLDLSSNKIATIPDRIFQSNRKLKHLLLKNNELTILAEDIFSYACFDCVNLTNNSIDCRSMNAFLGRIREHSCLVVDNEIKNILKRKY